MESLIARWKATKNSGNKSQDDSQRYQSINNNQENEEVSRFNVIGSNKKRSKNTSSSDSSSDSQIDKNQRNYSSSSRQKVQQMVQSQSKKILQQQQFQQQQQIPQKHNMPKSQSSKKLSPPPRYVMEQINELSLNSNQGKQQQQQQNRKKEKKNYSYLLDETVFRISESFKAGDHAPFQEKIVKIRNLLENYTENLIQLLEKGDLVIPKQNNEEEKRNSKIDSQQKIIKSLEEKVLQNEKQKLSIKQDYENLMDQFNLINRENESLKIGQQMYKDSKKNLTNLEHQNALLSEQLQAEKQRNKDQQILFQSQIQEVEILMQTVQKEIKNSQKL